MKRFAWIVGAVLGLICLGAPTRLGARTADAGSVRMIVGHGAPPGAYDYQLWYRNTAEFCEPDGFNLSNAVRHAWP